MTEEVRLKGLQPPRTAGRGARVDSGDRRARSALSACPSGTPSASRVLAKDVVSTTQRSALSSCGDGWLRRSLCRRARHADGSEPGTHRGRRRLSTERWKPHEAVRVMTGARVPRTVPTPSSWSSTPSIVDARKLRSSTSRRPPGKHILRVGEDIAAGHTIRICEADDGSGLQDMCALLVQAGALEVHRAAATPGGHPTHGK